MAQITVVIPASHRRSTLPRILDYYSKSPFQIVVCDSSPEPWSNPPQYSNLSYRSFPNWPYYAKIREVYGGVKTPFTIECPDDDFILTESILKAASFLDGHRDFAAVMGQWAVFDVKDRVCFRPKYLAQYLSVPEAGYESESAIIRLRAFFSNFTSWHHSLQRTEHLLRTSSLAMGDYFLSEQMLTDYLSGGNLAVAGKLKILPILFGVRSIEKNIVGTSTLLSRRGVTIAEAHAGKTEFAQTTFDRFVEKYAGMLQSKEGFSEDDSRSAVLKEFEIFFSSRTRKSEPNFERCRNVSCARFGCMKEAKDTSARFGAGYLNIAQSEDEQCLAGFADQLPLRASETQASLEHIASAILRHPLSKDRANGSSFRDRVREARIQIKHTFRRLFARTE